MPLHPHSSQRQRCFSRQWHQATSLSRRHYRSFNIFISLCSSLQHATQVRTSSCRRGGIDSSQNDGDWSSICRFLPKHPIGCEHISALLNSCCLARNRQGSEKETNGFRFRFRCSPLDEMANWGVQRSISMQREAIRWPVKRDKY